MTSTRDLTFLRRIAAALAALLLLAPGAAGQAANLEKAAELVAKAQADIAAGDGIAAEVRLKQAMADGAAREAVAAYMGEALIAQGELERARSWLAPGRFTAHTAALGFRTLARLERLEGNLPAAGAAFDRVIALTPKDAAMWVEIARLRYAGGEHVLALDAANYAFDLDPTNVRVLELRGQVVRDQRGLVASLPWFEAALARSPDDVPVLGEYAATLGDLGRARDMLAVTRKLLAVDPGNARAFYLQAVLAARAGNDDLARKLLGRVGDRLGEMPGKRLLEGVLELRAGNHVLAAEAFEDLHRRQPGNERILLLLVRSLYLAGEYRQLLIRFSPAGDEPQASPYLLTLLARSHEALGDREQAAALLDRAAVARASWPLPGQLAAVPTGQADDPFARPAPAVDPGNFDSLVRAGDGLLGQGNGQAALAQYRAAAQIRLPETLMLRMVSAHRLSGEPERGDELAGSYLAAHPASAAAARLAAERAVQAGDWRRARALLSGLQARGAGRDVRLLSDLALAQLQSGDAGAAVATASRAYRIQPASPLAAQAFGLALAAGGRRPNTARALLLQAQRSIGDTPLQAEARRRLDARPQG